MLQPALMHKLDVILYKDETQERVIEELHKLGVTEISFLSDKEIKDLNLERSEQSKRIEKIAEIMTRIYKIYSILKQFDTSKQTFLEQMLGIEKIEKSKIKRQNYDEVIRRCENMLKKIEDVDKIYEISSNIDKLNSEISETEKVIQELKLLPKNLQLGVLGKGRKFTIFAINFTCKKDDEKQEIERKIEKLISDISYITTVEIQRTKKEINFTSVIALSNEKSDVIEEILKLGKYIDVKNLSGSVEENIEKLTATIKEKKDKVKKFTEKLKDIFSSPVQNNDKETRTTWQEILICKELLEIEKDRAEILVNGANTKKTFYFKIFVPASESEKVIKKIKETSNNLCEINVTEDPEDAPTLMDNPEPIKKYEFLTAIYGLPKYKHFDPTVFVVPVMIFFIGMMIADAAYGLILLIISILMQKKYGKYSESTKNFFKLVSYTAIVAIIIGIINGDYFGNLLHNYYATSVLGITNPHEVEKVSMPGQFFHPEGADLKFYLQLAICIGAIHIWLGTLFGTFDNLRRKKYFLAKKVQKDGEKYKKTIKILNHKIQEFIAWNMFGLGMIIAFFGFIGNAFGFPFHPFDGQIFTYIAVGLILIGTLIAMKHNAILTPIEAIDYFAFILSYARIMALLVAAGAVASAFNTLAGSMWGVAFGIVAILIFLAGQTLHFLLGVLSAFVQALRLMYVEHFSRYYEGGGKMFNKFEEKRKYTILKE